jgi:hypothetical protein
LADCARDGRAAPAIACLFDRTLVGWHRDARPDVSYKLAHGFRGLFPRTDPRFEPRIARARDFGAERGIAELRALFERCTSTPVLIGPIHGDLKAANVRVRAADAIIIDFLQHGDGPLVFDAACLEASLLIDGFDDRRKLDRNSMSPQDLATLDSELHAWLASIETLYQDELLQQPFEHPHPKNRSCWFHGCVRQIRSYARQVQTAENQYAAALALAMLTKSIKDLPAKEPEASRRAIAYVLAERVLVNAFPEEDFSI